jgi:hypothetical protein
MTEVQPAPNLPQWMRDHVARYLASGGTDGHMYTITLPNLPPRAVPALLLTTTGRKSGQKYLFPLFYGQDGDSYFVIASKGGAPEHPGCGDPGRNREDGGPSANRQRQRAGSVVVQGHRVLATLRRVPVESGWARDSGCRAGSGRTDLRLDGRRTIRSAPGHYVRAVRFRYITYTQLKPKPLGELLGSIEHGRSGNR